MVKTGVSVLGPLRLELKGISKQFPGVLANDHVSVQVGAGEIHALLGENGAGKSTLVKMIYGIMQPDQGEIIWNGEAMRITFAIEQPLYEANALLSAAALIKRRADD